jgi:hypothetical protein
MSRCPECNEKGVIHYPGGMCTRCNIKRANEIMADSLERLRELAKQDATVLIK